MNLSFLPQNPLSMPRQRGRTKYVQKGALNMGKGSRNRENRAQTGGDGFYSYQEMKNKKNKKQGTPKWLFPLIAIVLVVALLGGAVTAALADNGVFKRGNVLIKSQTGKFDMTQQMATYIAWESIFSNASNAYTYWYYCSLGYITDTEKITKTYKSADQYALAVAATNIQYTLRDCIDDIADDLLGYVAVADKAASEGYKLTEEEQKQIDQSFEMLKSLHESSGYYVYNTFLDKCVGEGIRNSDIKKALTVVSLHNKYLADKQEGFRAAVTLADMEKYRGENPESFFTTDYLMYTAEDEAFAEKLKTATTPEEFKMMIADHYFSNNYKSIYNKYTVSVEADELLGKISGKVDNTTEGGTALTDALNSIGATEATYSKSDETLDSTLSGWLFNTARKKYDTTKVVTDEFAYVLAIMEINKTDDDTVVKVREVKLALAEGEEHEGDAAFKATLEKNYKIKLELLEDEEFKVENYKTSDELAVEFKTLLEAENADIAALMTEKEATETDKITKDSKSVPESIRKAIFVSGTKKDSIHKIASGNVTYVVWVKDRSEGNDIPTDAKLVYVAFEHDTYYTILNELADAAAKKIPADKSAQYTKEPDKEDELRSWLFADIGEDLKSAVKAGDTRYFKEEQTVTGSTVKTTVYNVYMVLENPMHFDTELYTNGGYLLIKTADESKENAVKSADVYASLTGKTGADLTAALSAASSNAVVSESISPSSVTDAKLKEWLFSTERKANDTVLLDNAAGDGKYVAVYLGNVEAWQVGAKSGVVSDNVQALVDSLTATYSINQKGLAKLGEPTPETTTAAKS